MLLVFSISLPCFADDTTNVLTTEFTETTTKEAVAEDTTTPDNATETEITGDALTTPVEDIETAPEEVTTPSIESGAEPTISLSNELKEIKDMVAVLSNVDDISELKELLSNSATWIMVGACILTIITVVGTVASKFNSVVNFLATLKDTLTGKANQEDLDSALDNAKIDIKNEVNTAYAENFKKVEKAWQKCEESIKNAEENEQKLYAMLTLFMTHCNIPTSAKAEILNLATGVKKYSGDVYEIVEQVEEAIQVDIAEKGGEMPETPTLDEILEEDYMDLG